MFLLVALLFAAAGVGFLVRREVRVGGQVLARPHTVFVGMILILQVPLGFLVGVAVGAAEASRVLKAGGKPDAVKIAAKYVWLDPAVIGGAAALAAVVGMTGLRPYVRYVEMEEEVVGVRTYDELA